MDLNSHERDILNKFLAIAEKPSKIWLVVLVLGAIFLFQAVVTLLFTDLFVAFSLLLLVLGLVTAAWGCEQRNKLIAAQILKRYHGVVGEREGADTKESGHQPNQQTSTNEKV